MKSFPSHIFAFSESVHGIRLCGAPPTKRTKVAELRIASKMCIHVPDEKHLGFKNSFQTLQISCFPEFVVCNEKLP
jgi:hypothetical protein